jgi:multidrug transporter EmrE-like cation transporter
LNSLSGYFYVGLTIALTVYGQLVLKWQVSLAGVMPEDGVAKLMFLLRLMTNLWVISGFAGAVLASVAWMAAMTKFELSYAYPFTSLAFVLVFLMSAWLFNESVTSPKLIGMGFIVVGIIISSRG